MTWQGVFPAVTTQFRGDFSVDTDATQNTVDQLVKDGVDGIVALGTVGENYALSGDEKLSLLQALVETVNGRVPVLTGVAETTTAEAIRYSQGAAKAGADGLMVMPGLVYQSDQDEALQHLRSIAEASDLPIMVYNNPVSYGVDLSVEATAGLRDLENIVAIKESTTDVRRITELRNAFGTHFDIFCGVDDIILPCLAVGATGWISGLTNVFPRESVALYRAAAAGDLLTARALFDWFLPLLRLDTVPKLVQCIKLCEQGVGRGSETVRPPRLALTGEERQQVERLLEQALDNRPTLPEEG
jgi:4-hydroxy-tetrahydrodipicolinate synthase